MQSWADALAENFRRLGGELRLGARVDKIVTRSRAAVGVEVNGEFHSADAVISAADYKKTFLELLDDTSLLSDAATPLTYERYTGNTGGATSAWSWNPRNKFFKNSISINVDSPVRNLFIGSTIQICSRPRPPSPTWKMFSISRRLFLA